MDGSLLGDGGARKAAGWGLGARLLAGEKCCWRVEKAGFFSCGCSKVEVLGVGSSDARGGGLRTVDTPRREEEDLLRTCPDVRALAGRVLVLLIDAFRR